MQGSERQDFAALHAPIAPFTWALNTQLDSAAEDTGEIPVRFTRPIEVLGIKASITPVLPLAGGGLTVPTIEDIDVFLLSDNEDLWTKTLKESGSAGGFVPLSHLTIDAPRLLRIVPKGDAPDFTFTFAWAQFIPGAPLFESAIIRLSLLTRYISKDARDEWLRNGTSPEPGK